MDVKAISDDGSFSWPVRVYYEDTDAAGYVYNANYLAFAERARTEWLRHLGFEQGALGRKNCVFVVQETTIKYRKPARLDDLLQVSVVPLDQTKASVTFTQKIRRGDDLVAELRTKVVCIHPTGRPQRIPLVISEKFESVMKNYE